MATHCKHGHPLTGENLYVSPQGLRQCITCRRKRHLRYYEANRAAAIKRANDWKHAHPERMREITRSRYERRRAQMKAANDRWRRNNPEKVRDIREARRARLRNAFVEYVDRAIVHERAAGLCGICRDPVALAEMELDHIIPLSRGGLHCYANAQPAHMTCNRRKHTKIEEAQHAA